MADTILSDSERIFIIHGIQDNLRSDGRGCEDYRPLELETDIMPNTNGSARVRLGSTDVLVGVKSELGAPQLEKSNEGRLEFFVDCSANATPEFEGRGGEDLATMISNFLYQAYDFPSCLDLRSLAVIPGQQVWVLYIDVLLLECGGNLVDAVFLAVKAALYNTRIPQISVKQSESDEAELEVSDDPYACNRLDVNNVPCAVTVSKIGSCHVVDATMQEEACCLARLMMSVTDKQCITAQKKAGSGSLSVDSLMEMVECGEKVGQRLNEVLMQRLTQEEPMRSKRKLCGFLA